MVKRLYEYGCFDKARDLIGSQQEIFYKFIIAKTIAHYFDPF